MQLNIIPKTEFEHYLSILCLKVVYLENDEQTNTTLEWKKRIISFINSKVPEAKQYLNGYRDIVRLYENTYDFLDDVAAKLITSPIAMKHFLNNFNVYLTNSSSFNHDSIWEDILNELDEKLVIKRLQEDDDKIQEHYRKTGGAGGRKSKISRR